ncbi:MAG: glycosyltransferase family 4 protein [Candidatus Eisenbacteria bacterium]
MPRTLGQRMTTTRGRVCFFSSYLWPSFSEGAIEFAGGAEVQQAVLARGLAARGFEVSVVTCDYGQGRRVERDGITFHATHPPAGGIPVLRFLHPRLSGNLRALLAARADVIYERGSGMQAGLALDVARWTRAGFVFAASHDHDARRDMPKVGLMRDRWWYARALRGADSVIAQTSFQQAEFRDEWGRDSTVIPNLVELPAAAVDAGQPGAVLWLSTYKDSKYPGMVVDLARSLPAIRFLMAGVIPPPPLTAEVFERTRAAAAGLPNLEVQGHIARKDLGAFFSGGALFLHTSPAEGFPNTLLEAWAHALPSVSMVDPDGLAASESLGELAEDQAQVTRALRAWMGNPARRRAAGERARRHVELRHRPAAIVERVATLLEGVIQKRRGAALHR